MGEQYPQNPRHAGLRVRRCSCNITARTGPELDQQSVSAGFQRQARLGPGLYRPDRASSKPANCLQGPSLYSYNAILVAVFQTKIGPTSEGETILSPATPSMRRPVCVRSVFLFLFSLSFLWIPCIRARPPLSPSFHPHSWLSDFRSVHGGCSQFSRCCYLIIDLGSRLSMEAGPGLSRSHLISAVELGCSDTISLFSCMLFFFLPAFSNCPQRHFEPGSPSN